MRPAELRTLIDKLRGDGDVHVRRWIYAQIGCILAIWLTLGTVIAVLALILAGVLPEGVPGWAQIILTILLAGSVGYATNYVAIQMLFNPLDPAQRHWLRRITLGLWRQGLIPQRRQRLAENIGTLVARDLFTPAALVDEVAVLLDRALDEPEIRSHIRHELEPVLRQALPDVIEKLTPEVTDLISEAAAEGLNRDSLLAIIEHVLAPWLEQEGNLELLADRIVAFMQNHVPALVEQMQHYVEARRGEGLIKRIAINFAEWSRLIDWGEVRNEIRKRLESAQMRRELMEWLGGLASRLQKTLPADEDIGAIIMQARTRGRAFIREAVRGFLQRELPRAVNRLLDSDALWQWIQQDGLALLKRQLLPWVRKHGEEVFARHVDVGRRVRDAVDGMDVAEVNEHVNRLAAEQLGAIQVLGFALGLVGGGLIVLLNLMG